MLKPIWHSPDDITFGPEEHVSMALVEVLEELREVQGAKVLDIGRANGANIEFLGPYCRSIWVEDILQSVSDDVFERVALGDAPRLDLSIEPLTIPHRFNVVLCWDLFNYLSFASIGRMVQEIRMVCECNALLYALVWRGGQLFTRPGRFRMKSKDCVIYDPVSPALRSYSPLNKVELAAQLVGFERHHSYRLRNGMDEELYIAV